MLLVFNQYEGIDFGQLMEVYAESNQSNGAILYPEEPENLQMLYAQQDFYEFLQAFFHIADARYFVWAPEGRYTAALRLEPFMDGLLLEALETLPAARGRGVASELINATIIHLHNQNYDKIYSHVHKQNLPSLAVHYKCGFSLYTNNAVYIDGTRHDNAYTLLCKL